MLLFCGIVLCLAGREGNSNYEMCRICKEGRVVTIVLSVAVYVVAVSVAWLLLGLPWNSHAVLYLCQKCVVCWECVCSLRMEAVSFCNLVFALNVGDSGESPCECWCFLLM
jgi:hypothetical protein